MPVAPGRFMRASTPLLSLMVLLAVAPSAAAQGPPPPLPLWDVQLGAAFVGTGGNSDTTTLGGDFGLHRRWPVWTIESAATAVRATSDNVRTAERYLGAFRVARKLSTIVSLTAGERAERDKLAGMAFRSILDAGLSWSLVRGPAWRLDAVTAVAWNHEQPTLGLSRNDPIGVLQMFSRSIIGANADTSERFTFYPDGRDSHAYRAEAEVTAQAAMTSRLAMKFGYLWRYSNAPIAGFQKSDSTETASIVVRWRSTTPAP
jgi:putative salt-induced outer membrane protein